jgi:hypothetical protein
VDVVDVVVVVVVAFTVVVVAVVATWREPLHAANSTTVSTSAAARGERDVTSRATCRGPPSGPVRAC